MRGACVLCDGREHETHQHYCRVCNGLVDEDKIRFTLMGSLVCELCRIMVDGPDEDELEA